MTKKDNTKTPTKNRYTPVFRIIHLLMMATGALLFLTGLRLLCFNWIDSESWWVEVINRLSLSGAVLNEHTATGLFLVALAAFYFVHLVLSRDFWKLFLDADCDRTRRSVFLALNVSLALTCVTGISLAYDYTIIFGYKTVVAVHLIVVSVLILLVIFRILHTLFSAGLGKNDLFFCCVRSARIFEYAVTDFDLSSAKQIRICRWKTQRYRVDGGRSSHG